MGCTSVGILCIVCDALRTEPVWSHGGDERMTVSPNGYDNATRTVGTSIGELEYVGGFPTDDTVRRAFDQLDLQRATQVYLEFMPFMSQQALFDSHELVMRENGDVGVFDYQMQGKVEWVGLTFNTESIYCSATLNAGHIRASKNPGAVHCKRNRPFYAWPRMLRA
jgi:hypothetical protein